MGWTWPVIPVMKAIFFGEETQPSTQLDSLVFAFLAAGGSSAILSELTVGCVIPPNRNLKVPWPRGQ